MFGKTSNKNPFTKGATFTAWFHTGEFPLINPKANNSYDVPNGTILTVQACEGKVVIVTADQPAKRFISRKKLPAGTPLKTHTSFLELIEENRRKHEVEAQTVKKLLKSLAS